MAEPPGFADLSHHIQLHIKALGRETNNLAYGYAGALMLSRPPSLGGPVSHGSGIIIRYGPSYSFLTAAHIVEQGRDLASADPQARLHLAAPNGSATFTIGDRLRHYDRSRDLAVLHITAEEAVSTGLYPYDLLDWPPPEPKLGEQVYLAGFPGEGRSQIGPKAYEFLSFTLGTQVSSIAEDNFKCVFDRSEWISQNGAPLPPSALGGVSGGPVMAMRDLRLTLLGVVQEHSDSLDIMIVSTLKSIPLTAFAAA